MRIKSILKEQQAQNEHYDIVINGVTSKFWESLVEMNGKPLSEAAVQTNNKVLETMLYQTAMFLPDAQRERFFESLLNPKDNQLDEGVFGDIASGIAKVQDKIDAGKAYVAKKVVAGVKGAFKIGSEIFDKFVPESVKALGAAIIKKVKEAVGVVITKAASFLKMIAEKLNLLGKQDPCSAKMESFDFRPLGSKLYEAMDDFGNEIAAPVAGAKYFTGDKASFLGDPSVKAAGDISMQVAKAIALTKSKGIDVHGSDFRNILADVAKQANDSTTLKIADDPTSQMSKWFFDNKMKTKIASAEGKPLATAVEGAFCSIEPSFVDTHFGPTSSFGAAYTKLGLEKETALEGIIKELKNSKVSLFITLASLIFSFASGVGALRIVGLVFASVIPLIITARITDLENKGAPAEQIEFWKKARSISKFINTVIQIFNIANLMSRGWEAMAQTNTESVAAADPNKVAAAAAEVDPSDFVSYDKLDATALARMDKWGETLNPAQYEHFKLEVIPKMSNEEFTELQDMLLANNNEAYARLATTVKNYAGADMASFAQGEVVIMPGSAATAELAQDNAAIAARKAANTLKASQETSSTVADIPTADAATSYTTGQQVTLGDGTTGTVGELVNGDNGAKFYKITRDDGTVEWLPAENATTPKDAAIDAAVKSAFTEDKVEAMKNITASTLNDENKQLLTDLLNDPKLNAGTASKLVALTSDQSQLNALNSLNPDVSKEYLTTFGKFKSPLTPTQIVDLGISHPATAAQTVDDMRASGVIGSSRYLLSTLQKIGIDVNQPLSSTDLSAAIDKIREIEKLKDVAGVTPTLST